MAKQSNATLWSITPELVHEHRKRPSEKTLRIMQAALRHGEYWIHTERARPTAGGEEARLPGCWMALSLIAQAEPSLRNNALATLLASMRTAPLLTSPRWLPALFSVARDAAILSAAGVAQNKSAKLCALEVVVAALQRLLWHGFATHLRALPRVHIPSFVHSLSDSLGALSVEPDCTGLCQAALLAAQAQLRLLSELSSTSWPAPPPAALFSLRQHATYMQLLPTDPAEAAHDFVMQIRVYAADARGADDLSALDEAAVSDIGFALLLARPVLGSHPEACRVMLDGLAVALSQTSAGFAEQLALLLVETFLDASLMERNASCLGLMLEHPQVGLLALARKLKSPHVPTAAVAAVSTSASRKTATRADAGAAAGMGVAAAAGSAAAATAPQAPDLPPTVEQSATEALLTLRLRSTEAASFPMASGQAASEAQSCAEMLAHAHLSVVRNKVWLAEAIVSALLHTLGVAALEPPVPGAAAHAARANEEEPLGASPPQSPRSPVSPVATSASLLELLSTAQPQTRQALASSLPTAHPLAPIVSHADTSAGARRRDEPAGARPGLPQRQQKSLQAPELAFQSMIKDRVARDRQQREVRQARKRAAKERRERTARAAEQGDAAEVLGAPEA